MPTEEQEVQKALDAKFKKLNDNFIKVQADLAKAQENSATKEQIESLTATLKTQGEALEEFIESQKAKVINSTLKQFEIFLTENKEKIKEIYKAGNGNIEFIPKAVEEITTGSGTNATAAPANATTQLGEFNLRNDNDLMSLMTVSSSSRDVYSYTEMLPKEGNFAFVGEGEEKPQIDFSWVNRFAEPKKIAAYEILTEEAATDIVRLMSVARGYLRKKHDLFKVRSLFFALGTGTLPTGATVYGRLFSAGPMALALTNPNFMDVVNAAITDIYTTQNYTDEMEYMANLVLINPVDFFIQFQSAKDANGLSLYPQASLFNTVNIGGVTIKPWAAIPAGKIFVADMTKYNLINYIPFSIRIGWINEQFITNMFTMLGESRFFQFVKNLDEQAFIYDDIATIKTAITAVP